MFGAGGDLGGKAQARKLCGSVGMLIVIDFIDDENQGFVYPAEALSEIEIYWGDAVLSVDHKEEKIT